MSMHGGVRESIGLRSKKICGRGFSMVVLRGALVAVVVAWACVSACHAAGVAGAAQRAGHRVDFGEVTASADARYLAQWVVDSRDNDGKPFAVVDKKDARMFVFGPAGQVVGATPVLLGLAFGDHAVAGTGALLPSRIPAADRTTPAGRFETQPGFNLTGEDVIWFDYDAGLAIHRLRPDAARVSRQRSLDTAAPDAHRVSAGCVVVPVVFYLNVLRPTLATGRAVVYVLPETRPVRELFAGRESEL